MTYLPTPPASTAPNAGSLSDADLLSLGQAGVTRRATLATLKVFLAGGATGSTGATGSVSGSTGTTGTSAGTTGSTGTTTSPAPAPAFVAATQYQTATASTVSAASVSLQLANTPTAHSTVLLMASGSGANASTSPGKGWTQLVNIRQGYGFVAAWSAPSTILSSGPVVLGGLVEAMNAALIETSAASFETWYGPLSGGTSASYGLLPRASSAPSLRYGMMCSYNGGGLSSLSGASSLALFPGNAATNSKTGHVTVYWAGAAFSSSASSSSTITAAPAYSGPHPDGGLSYGCQPFGLIVNAFGASISGLTSNYAYTPGLTATPAVLPGPVAGRPQYYIDYVARWKGGQTLPPPQVGMYNGPAPQFTEKANFSYWLQRSVDVLEFGGYEYFHTGDNNLLNSSKYVFGYQLSMGAKSENITFSIGVCCGDSTLFDVAASYYDSEYAQIAQYIIAQGGGAAEIRLGWEMNEGYYSFAAQNDQTGYSAAFRRIVWLMRQQPGAQFLFTFCPLLVGYQQGSDPNNYLPDADAIDFIGGDYYPSKYMWGSATTVADQHAAVHQHLYSDGSSSVSWMDGISQKYGIPMTFSEFASGSTRDDGYGCGDDGSYLVDFHEWQHTNNKPVFRFGYWESGSGGTNSKMAPYDDGTLTPFPNSAAQYLSYYRGPVLSAGSPTRPAPPVSFTASGASLSSYTISYGAFSSAGGTPQYQIVQFSVHGQNKWTSWNWMGLSQGGTGPNAAFPAGTTQVDVRLCFANAGGLSAWAQVTIDTATGKPTATVIYSSAYGNNDTTAPDPAIVAPPALPPVPVGTASTPVGATGSASSTGGAGSTNSSGATTSATAAITDITGHTFNATLPNAVYTYYQNESGLNANVFVYSDGGTGWVIAPSDANLIPKIVLTKNGNPVAATGFTDITNL